jgi:hypothetical protein
MALKVFYALGTFLSICLYNNTYMCITLEALTEQLRALSVTVERFSMENHSAIHCAAKPRLWAHKCALRKQNSPCYGFEDEKGYAP